MWRKGTAVLLVTLTCVAVLPRCHSQGSLTVIDGYTHNNILTSGDLVSLGTQIILVCWVVGLPYGTPLSYTWTCPNGPCEVEGYYGRKVYNEHILAVNTTSTSDGGTYTCQVTAKRQEATGNFTLTVTDGRVVHSYGRLIPHEFPITDLQQISGPDGIGRITCTVSSGTARFAANSGGQLETGEVSQTRNGATATLAVNPSNVDSFQNRGLYCTSSSTNFFYLSISSANSLSVPSLMVGRVTNSAVEYQVRRIDGITNAPLITGYEVTRFGVPMIGEYVYAGRGRGVIISPAVPGAQYRITAWALGDGRRSATPAVVDATTGEARPTLPRMPSITRRLVAGIELNWLPPTEPNGEVHYVIYYTPEGGTEQSIDAGSNLTHYNLTGLERNRVYTDIAVQVENSAGSSGRSAAIAQYNHTPPDTAVTGPPPPPGPTSRAAPSSNPLTTAPSSDSHCTAPSSYPLLPAVVSLGVVVLLLITCVALLVLALAVTATKLNNLRTEKAHTDHLSCYNKTGGGEEESKDRIYDEVGEGTGPVGEQKGQYQELKLETLDRRQYDTLHGGH